MATAPKQFSEAEIEAVWQKAFIQANNDPSVFRKDYAGAWIRRNDYGKNTIYGWQIDHVRPLALNGSHDMKNLLPLHWENNEEKSDNFPNWTTKKTSRGITNVDETQTWHVKAEEYV